MLKKAGLLRPGLGFEEIRERSRSPIKNMSQIYEKTVMVSHMHPKTHKRDLEAFFSAVGKVKEVNFTTNNTSKNIAFVQFEKADHALAAIHLSGRSLLATKIEITAMQGSKRAKTETFPEPVKKSTPFGRLYVGNLHFKVNTLQLKEMFEPFGKIEFINLVEDNVGRSRGFAFVKYFEPEHANMAIEALDGVPIYKRNIKVNSQDSRVNSQNIDFVTMENERMQAKYNSALKRNFKPEPKEMSEYNQNINQSDKSAPVLSAHPKPAQSYPNDDSNNTLTYDWDHQPPYMSGDSYQNADRAKTMPRNNSSYANNSTNNSEYNQGYYAGTSREDNSANSYIKGNGQQTSVQTDETSKSSKTATIFPGTPSQCLMATNMFDPTTQNGEEWAAELCDDVIEEIAKFEGSLLHIFVDQTAAEGNVYLKGSSLESAWSVVRALHGRYFDGRQVKVESVPLALYHKLFPKSSEAIEPIPLPNAPKQEASDNQAYVNKSLPQNSLMATNNEHDQYQSYNNQSKPSSTTYSKYPENSSKLDQASPAIYQQEVRNSFEPAYNSQNSWSATYPPYADNAPVRKAMPNYVDSRNPPRNTGQGNYGTRRPYYK